MSMCFWRIYHELLRLPISVLNLYTVYESRVGLSPIHCIQSGDYCHNSHFVGELGVRGQRDFEGHF